MSTTPSKLIKYRSILDQSLSGTVANLVFQKNGRVRICKRKHKRIVKKVNEDQA